MLWHETWVFCIFSKRPDKKFDINEFLLETKFVWYERKSQKEVVKRDFEILLFFSYFVLHIYI